MAAKALVSGRVARLVGGTQSSPLGVFQTRVGVASRKCFGGDQNQTSFRREVRMKSTAKFFVGGNWKCNGSTESIITLVDDLNAGSIPSDVDVVCAPPFVYLSQVKATLKWPYQISAQDCWVGASGAYTGEVAAEMLADVGISWVILGHSERRALCGESPEFVGEKVAYAQSKGLSVIPCIGETLKERESGEMFNVLETQLRAIVDGVSNWDDVVLAYEPVWAIGTGVVATPEQAQEVHAYLRKWVADNVGADVAANLRIIYGGSVNDGNCVDLAGREDIDGFLVGGASLKGASFVQICNANKH
ncbi:hypothetical protein BSKO_02952 [Bryopsis sp. KO-2023]|nr:hypothetical protein BSKO_02952 [Bryopsis sp. KO-2023]